MSGAARILAAGLILAPLPAMAQGTPKPGAIISRACAPRPNMSRTGAREASQTQLAEALLAESGILPSDFVDAVDRDLTYRSALFKGMKLLARDVRGEAASDEADAVERLDPDGRVRGAIQNLGFALNGGESGLIVTPAGTRPIALYAEEQPRWTLTCKPKPESTFVTDVEDPASGQSFAIRKKPEELGLTGKEAKAAGAFELAFSRTRTDIAGGGTKTDTNLSVDGTVGLRLTGASEVSSAYLFGRYQLERARTRPAPTLAPGASQGDGDTNALEAGLTGTLWLNTDKPVNFAINGQLSGVFDFANDSQRAKAKIAVTPGFDLPDGAFPLCGIGQYQRVSGKLTARCGMQFEVEAAHVFRAGTAKIGAQDLFVAAGGKLSYELFLPTDSGGSEVVAGFSYRYLPVVHGALQDIERMEAQLKHRFWSADKIGIDVGFSYNKGTSELSFEEEDVFKFGVGLIF